MRLKASNLADVGAQFGSVVVGRGVYVLLQVVLARSLGPHGFGLYAIGWTVVGLASTLAPIGMPQAMLRFSIGGRSSLHALPMWIVALVGLAGSAAIWTGADLLATQVFGEAAAAPVIRGFAPALPLLGVFSVMLAAMRVSHAMLSSAVIGALSSVLYLGVTLLAFTAGPSPVAAADGYAVSLALTIIPAALLLHAAAPTSDAPPAGRLLHFGIVTMFIHGANVLNIWADRVVIGIMSDPETLGMYQVASQLAMVVVVLRSAVTTVFETAVPKPKSGGPPPDITREFFAAYRLLLHVSAPGLVVLIMTAGFWIRLLFGAAYLPATLPLMILVVGQFLLTFAGPSVPALHMTGEERRVMGLTVGTCMLNIAGNVALIPVFGASGAAFATLVANAIVGFACFGRLARTGRLRFSIDRVRDVLLATGSSAAACAVISGLSGALSVYSALGMLVAAYAVYGLVVCAACTVEDEFVQLGRSLLRRLMRRPVSP